MVSRHLWKPLWRVQTCPLTAPRHICTGGGFIRRTGLHPGASVTSPSPSNELHPTPRLIQHILGTAVYTRMEGSSTLQEIGCCRTTRCTHTARRSPHFPRHRGRKATVGGHPMQPAPVVRAGTPVSGGPTTRLPPEAASPGQRARHTEALPDTVALQGDGERPGLLGM